MGRPSPCRPIHLSGEAAEAADGSAGLDTVADTLDGTAYFVAADDHADDHADDAYGAAAAAEEEEVPVASLPLEKI